MSGQGLTPSERRMRGAIGAHKSWGHTEDRTARTEPARKAFDDRFDQQADPDRVLTAEERAKKAASLRKEYFTRLAFESAKARRRKAGA